MASVQAADQTSISFTDRGGQGAPVLLVHGITENSRTWEPVTERLGETHRVITMDLRGHGSSGTASDYGLEAMAGDVVTVADHLGVLGEVHLVGHSLGGAVVSAVGGAAPVASIVNVDQTLRLGALKAQLGEVEPLLRDSETFRGVIDGLFSQLAGSKIDPAVIGRVNELRRPDQDVVLGVWDLMFTMTEDEINEVVEEALGGFAETSVPYFSLFGEDPGPDYQSWLSGFISGARVELWEDYGHYPHLVDPDRFVETLNAFWGRVRAD